MENKIKAIIKQNNAAIERAQKNLQINGIYYSLSEWVTIKEYVRRHNLSSTSVVSNWIDRGIVTPDDIIEVEELNSLKLIKDKQYRS